MGNYANPGMLASVDWLKQSLGDPQLRLLDVRAGDPRLPIGYRMAHIPGAIGFDPTRDFFIFANGVPELAGPEKMERVLGQRGVSEQMDVVIYDEWTGQLAAMTFWVLRYLGHVKLQILNGGWTMWQNHAGPRTQETPEFEPVEYHAHIDVQARATAEWIQANSGRPDLVLLDVRTPEEFTMGHIPGAVNLSYDSALDLKSQTFKAADELTSGLEALGVTPEKEIVTYCAAGARSAHMFTTLQLLGYPRVRNYEGSMADWYHVRGLPIE